MNKSMYQHGYDDGFREKPQLPVNDHEYMKGYQKGKEDKEFCDTYSDENMGIFGGFDG